jgi:hypothetical protein
MRLCTHNFITKAFVYKYVLKIINGINLTIEYLKPNELYKGRNYSEWIEEWSNWLVSSSVDYNADGTMLFLRGNLEYESDQSGNRFVKPGKLLDRTGSLGVTISNDTAVFIPIMTAMFSLNDPHESLQMLDEQGLRYAVRRDISEGGNLWLRYKESNDKYQSVVPSLNIFYFETSIFTLRVSNENPLLSKFESAFDPGEYQTVQGGYFVILDNLTSGTYRLHFGGIGRGYYYTDAVYDINVQSSKRRDLTNDVSSLGPLPISNVGAGDRLKKYLHIKNESDIDAASPFP